MLSSLVDVNENVCYDYILSKHFNECASARKHLSKLVEGDVVIFDRGYFSASLYNDYFDKGVDTIFRLKLDAFKDAQRFFKSKHTDQIITAIVASHKVHIRLVKYFIDNKTYVLGTSLLNKSKSCLEKLYKKRWNVELSFRRLKSNLNLNYTFSLKEETWNQNVQVRILADTVSIILTENHTHKSKRPIINLLRFVRTIQNNQRFKQEFYSIVLCQCQTMSVYYMGGGKDIVLIHLLEVPP